MHRLSNNCSVIEGLYIAERLKVHALVEAQSMTCNSWSSRAVAWSLIVDPFVTSMH